MNPYDEIPEQDIPLNQLLAETLDLVDQRVAQVSNEDIENQLRRLLTVAGRQADVETVTTGDTAPRQITVDMEAE